MPLHHTFGNTNTNSNNALTGHDQSDRRLSRDLRGPTRGIAQEVFGPEFGDQPPRAPATRLPPLGFHTYENDFMSERRYKWYRE